MSLLNIFLESLPSGAALGNHVWQSTLFAGVCWLAALLLKRNRASIRYWIWLAASAKFLLPFSILVGIGAYAGKFTDVRVVPAEWSVGQPVVTSHVISVGRIASYATVSPMVRTTESGFVQRILFNGWLAGVAIVGLLSIERWRCLAARIGKTTLLIEGREREAFRRVQSRFGLSERVRLASSASSIEPGVRGIMRPVLLLPTGITDRLADDQLETIILHELAHIRRRDNLAAAFHVIVQTIFWFHPLVWWIGAHLVNERERSCDEDVLRMGSDPRVYASAILRVCEFYLAAPPAVVSRITGSNLKTRIEDIMTQRIVLEMGSGRKLLLVGAAVALMAAPVLSGMTTVPQAVPSPQAVPPPSRETAVALRPAPTSPAPTPSSQARTPPPTPAPPFPTSRNIVVDPSPVQEPRSEYLLRVGDAVEIVVWKQPELTRRGVIRPDGKIGIPLVGDLPAEGLPPVALQRRIQEELKPFLSEPLVTVIVAEARKAFVTIQGSIARPGLYPLEGRVTVLRLIAQAGGLSEFAKPGRISVFREEAGVVRQYIFNYDTFLAGANLDQNIVLKEDDIVIVP